MQTIVDDSIHPAVKTNKTSDEQIQINEKDHAFVGTM